MTNSVKMHTPSAPIVVPKHPFQLIRVRADSGPAMGNVKKMSLQHFVLPESNKVIKDYWCCWVLNFVPQKICSKPNLWYL